ncbi:TPA: hypothetical protein LEL88_003171 [Vibrio cholerae]|uniref:Flagellar basal-body/hook protein C-terminal domain-containing protein n=4 Tax=Vibrio cholerae TaxID=666 RepID=Q9KLM1_VIBCH|nr:hypothetical protein [Vibrio cholerae]EEY48121.1 hypothetical protein VIG_002135 [Vibrio cholerae INDRE 91/1]MDG6206271.1 hypothetical protein [Vibrio sp. NO3-D2]AAF96621.1 hypothetical protein VC_A0722 [Vibrio cholerae O1 biovar El Tor str. N16961]ACP07642.1 conserved hypothetical protein [Vibrio cholerae M66-2]ACQ62559.1 hypothetical protein VCD_000597 [Vibrio cholerae MJ-1236]
MSVSAVSNGSSMVMHSSKMMEDAAREIQQASLPVESTIGKPIDPTLQPAPSAPKKQYANHIDALNSLNQASHYSRIGTNLIQRDQDMLGTMLDVRV